MKMLKVEIKVTAPKEWQKSVESWMRLALRKGGLDASINWTPPEEFESPGFEIGEVTPKGIAKEKEVEEFVRNVILTGFAMEAGREAESLTDNIAGFSKN